MLEKELVAVRAIIANKEGKVLLGKRARGTGAGQWALFGGKPDPGETLAEAIIREVSEETGLRFHLPELLLTTPGDQSVLGQSWTVHFFTGSTDGELLLNNETSEARYFSGEELKNLDIAFNHRLVLTTYFSYYKGV